MIRSTSQQEINCKEAETMLQYSYFEIIDQVQPLPRKQARTLKHEKTNSCQSQPKSQKNDENDSKVCNIAKGCYDQMIEIDSLVKQSYVFKALNDQIKRERVQEQEEIALLYEKFLESKNTLFQMKEYNEEQARMIENLKDQLLQLKEILEEEQQEQLNLEEEIEYQEEQQEDNDI